MSQVFYESQPDFAFNNDKPLVFHKCFLETEVLPHWHAHLEILFPQTGTLELTINSATVIAKPGELIIINSHDLHSIKVVDGGQASYRCLIMDEAFFKAQQFNYAHFLFPQKTTNLTLITLYQTLMHTFDTWERSPEKNQSHLLLIKGYMLQFMSQLVTTLQPDTLTDQPHIANDLAGDLVGIDAVKKGIDYIRHHYQTPLQLDDICQAVGMSKFHFCRTFKKVTNQTVNQYITQSRCIQAQYLLRQTDLTINECAEACGYTDPSYFSKIYKKGFGYLPSEEIRKTE